MVSRGRRIALYSHDAMGIGHVRRNLVVADALGRATGLAEGGAAAASTLLISGAYESAAFRLPPGVDCLTLPSVRKAGDGSYVPRRFTVAAEDVLALRSAAIRAALLAFDPDVLIVDKLPRGVGRELEPTLDALRRRGRARCVLGLRDVLDDAAAVRRDWRRDAAEEAVRDWYDAVWVYGCPRVCDPVAEYGLSPAVAAKVRYTGYFDTAAGGTAATAGGNPLAALNLPGGPFALCMVGGGEDGAGLAQAFAEAPLPPGMNAIVLTGPFMPPAAMARLRDEASGRPRLRVIEFVPDPRGLLARATRVVSMGGYNTVWEVLAHGRPLLIVPRVTPRREQAVRADRLRDLGLADALAPADATPASIGAWLARPVPQRRPAGEVVDMAGLDRLGTLLRELLAGGGRPEPGTEEPEVRAAEAGATPVGPTVAAAGRTGEGSL